MFIMPSAPAILLLVCAFNACVVSTNPVPDNSPPWTLQYAKRAGVNITVFNDTSCGQDYEGPRPGSLVLTEWELNLTYGEMVNTSFTIQSYNLSRFLSSSERLDWSGPYASDTVPRIPEVPEACGSYDQTTSPDSNGNPLHEETCYLLDPGATVRCLSPEAYYRS